MIRSIIDPDIKEIDHIFDVLKMRPDTVTTRAWTRLQIKLYRYSDLLEHLKTLPQPSEAIKHYLVSEEYDLKESKG